MAPVTVLMYAIGALSLAVAAISLALLGWRLIRTSRRDRFVAGFLSLPIAFLVLLILLILRYRRAWRGRISDELVYLLAGAGKQ
jgi:hypothetical protein